MSNEDDINVTTATKRRWKWNNIFLALAVIYIIYACWAFYHVVSMAYEADHELHAFTLVLQLVEEYVEDNQGAWPRSWKDLEQSSERERRVGIYSWPDDAERVKMDVIIDFSADPDELAKQSVEEFEAVKSKSGLYDYEELKLPLLRRLQFNYQMKAE